VRRKEVLGRLLCSSRFWRPTARACRLATPARATAGEVLALADQALVELAGEQGNLVVTEVMAKRAAGEADLLAAAGDQQGRIKQGPAFWGLEERWGHGQPLAKRTSVLADGPAFVCLARGTWLAGRKRCCSMGLALPLAEWRRVSCPQLAGLASGVGLLARSTHQWESRQNQPQRLGREARSSFMTSWLCLCNTDP